MKIIIGRNVQSDFKIQDNDGNDLPIAVKSLELPKLDADTGHLEVHLTCYADSIELDDPALTVLPVETATERPDLPSLKRALEDVQKGRTPDAVERLERIIRNLSKSIDA